MSRFEFKVWNIADKKMHDVDRLLFEDLVDNAWNAYKEIPEEVTGTDRPEIRVVGRQENGDILLQCSGLLDKNGVEIFEGDILENTANEELLVIKFGEYKTPIMVGRYESEGSFVKHSGWYLETIGYLDNKLKTILDHCDNALVVVGNIYENPELISIN